MSRLQDKCVLITGASSGLGRSLACEFAQHGAKLLLFARGQAGLEETATLVQGLSSQAIICPGDITLQEDRERALALAEEMGGLDVLVNNAGVSAHGRFDESSPERLWRIMEVNLFAVAEFIREAIPLLSEGNDSAVVNIGSVMGWRGMSFNSEYCTSKFALRGLSEAIRPELMRLGIHLLHCSPGPIDTEFFDHLLNESESYPWKKRRGVSPDYCAERILHALHRRRNEVIVGRQAWWFVQLSTYAPWLMDWVTRRYG